MVIIKDSDMEDEKRPELAQVQARIYKEEPQKVAQKGVNIIKGMNFFLSVSVT